MTQTRNNGWGRVILGAVGRNLYVGVFKRLMYGKLVLISIFLLGIDVIIRC